MGTTGVFLPTFCHETGVRCHTSFPSQITILYFLGMLLQGDSRKPSEICREKWAQSLCSSACPHLQAKPTLELAHQWFSFPVVIPKSARSSFRAVHLSLQQTWLCRTGKRKFPHNKQDWGFHSSPLPARLRRGVRIGWMAPSHSLSFDY